MAGMGRPWPRSPWPPCPGVEAAPGVANSDGVGRRQEARALLCGRAGLPLSLSAGTSRGQYHTLQSGFSSRSQGLSGDKTSVSNGPSPRGTI